MKKLILVLASVLMFTGCATTSVPETSTKISDFDGTKSIAGDMNTVGCTNNYLTCSFFSFIWSEKTKENATILVTIQETNNGPTSKYRPISSVKMNIDDEIVTLKAVSENKFDYNTNHKITDRLYVVPLEVLERVRASNTTKAQIIADGAIVERNLKIQVNNNNKETKVGQALNSFLDSVNEARK